MTEIINTAHAPKAIGTYSQAVRCGNTVYLSGQIPLDPQTMELCSSEVAKQIVQVIKNLQAVCIAAGGELKHVVKLTVYLTDLSNFHLVNAAMEEYFTDPYPARVTLQASALPRGALVEIDAIMVLE